MIWRWLLFCCTLMVFYATCFSGGMDRRSAYTDRRLTF